MTEELEPICLQNGLCRYLIIGNEIDGLQQAKLIFSEQPNAEITIHTEKNIIQDNPDNPKKIVIHQQSYDQLDINQYDIIISVSNDNSINKKLYSDAINLHKYIYVKNHPELTSDHINHPFFKIIADTITSSSTIDNNPGDRFADTEENITRYDFKKIVAIISILFFTLFVGFGLSTIITVDELKTYAADIPDIFWKMLLVGFVAQIIDGAIGLGYGIMCSTTMMLMGVKLPAISGSIHTAEIFSSGISGFSHYKFGNVNKKLFLALVIPGVIGAVAGSLLLVYLGTKYETITYVILATYTLFIGVKLLFLGFKKKVAKQKVKNAGILGFAGGFLDSFAGGGWGPVVTSTLLSKGKKSRFVVGTVSLTEFFVTFAASLTFFFSLGISHGYIVAGLIVGGIIASPIAAKLAGKIPQKIAILAVATLVIVFSIRIILKVI